MLVKAVLAEQDHRSRQPTTIETTRVETTESAALFHIYVNKNSEQPFTQVNMLDTLD